MPRLVMKCKLHTNTIEPLLTTHHDNPVHCPECTRHTKTRGWDEYDDLIAKYRMSRALSHVIDVFLREHLNDYNGSLEANMRARFKLPQPTSSGYTPITCTCNTCHSTFRFFNTLPTIQTPPLYCPYCASSISVCQDSDLDCWESLAAAYNTTVPLIKLFYTLFTQQNARTHFNDFFALVKEQMKEMTLD